MYLHAVEFGCIGSPGQIEKEGGGKGATPLC